MLSLGKSCTGQMTVRSAQVLNQTFRGHMDRAADSDVLTVASTQDKNSATNVI